MKYDSLFALLRRRGVLWPTAEIYGGAAGLYDYGPLGAALKRRVEDAWTRWFVGLSDDFHLIEPAEILPEPVVRASGHLENFTDPEVTCGQCHTAFRADTVLEATHPAGVDGLTAAEIGRVLEDERPRCPKCGAQALTVARPFNLMFGVDLGAVGGERGYLRPETAQSSFLAFSRMWDVGRRALPLGIAVIGRAYRNEIAPRQVLFRMRAFTQAELQVFLDPDAWSAPGPLADDPLPIVRADRRIAGDATTVPTRPSALIAAGMPAFYAYFLAHMFRFFVEVLGVPAASVRLWEKSDQERAFYNRIQFDVEVAVESLGGFREIGAVHYRGDYDLTRHGAGSGRDLSIALEGGRRLVPHVLELTFGVDRAIWALADLGLVEEDGRTVWRLPPYLAPVGVAVLPLMKKEHGPTAQRIGDACRAAGMAAMFDESGSIGRRYARADEAGTPFAVTVDGATLGPEGPEMGTVTLRHRDTRAQERVPIAGLVDRLAPSLRPPTAPRHPPGD